MSSLRDIDIGNPTSRTAADAGDDGSNDPIVSQDVRASGRQSRCVVQQPGDQAARG